MIGLVGFYLTIAIINGWLIFPWYVEQTLGDGLKIGMPVRDLGRLAQQATWRAYAIAGALWPAVVLCYATMRLMSMFDRDRA